MNDHEGAEPIAIVGMACRVPGAPDVDTFWENLVSGVESRTMLTRRQMLAAGATEAEIGQDNWVPAAFLLENVPYFDAELFGMTPREAETADPQHRVFLELCHRALADAGYDPARYPGDIGVFGGRGTERYRWERVGRNRRMLATTAPMAIGAGNLSDSLTTFVSYKLNLRGPSVGLYTACSTSLVAVHMACEALRAGEADLMLAGGVSIEFDMERGYPYVEGVVQSADGHVRPFDADASGTMWSSGGGVVVLKRLAEALADGDTIRALVRGNAINNDGSTKVGFTAPSVDGQAAAVANALAVAGVDPRTIGYVEAHGTATVLGDPIEVTALTSAYGRNTGEVGWCGLGSVKSNIGHLSQGAGVAGLIKAVLALDHGLIPPSLNYERPNPRIDFDRSPFYVNAVLSKWEPAEHARRAAVSSFGIGGTNAHIVLEQAPEVRRAAAPAGPALLRVSARTEKALAQAAEQLATVLTADPCPNLADTAHTLRVGRTAYQHRAFAVAGNAAEAAQVLRDKRARQPSVATESATRVALLFTGQGAQYGGMGAQLYQREPVFAAAVDECAAVCDPLLGKDIRELMFAAGPDADAALGRTQLTQPALFSLEYALARLWQSWGLRAEVMLGHSIGEYVAAALSGVFELPDAVRLVVTRGRLMQTMPPGAMLAVPADEAEVAALLPDGLSIAAVNGPGTCVVSGPTELIEQFADSRPQPRKEKRLRTSHAFHSPMMDPLLAEFTEAVAAVPRHAPSVAFVSNVTGEPITAEQAVDPAYWAQQLRQPVRFGAGVAALLAGGPTLFVECGPGRQLAGLVRMQTRGQGMAPVHSLPGPGDKLGDLATLYSAAGRLWAAGVEIDPPTTGRRIPLPGYPYQRSRYWVEPDQEGPATGAGEAVTEPDSRLPQPRWFAVPTWRQLPPAADPVDGDWLVFTAEPVGRALADALRRNGNRVTEVTPDDVSSTADTVDDVSSTADYAALLAGLSAQPARIVHAWALAGEPAGTDIQAAWRAQELGMFSVTRLLKALSDSDIPQVRLDVLTSGTQHVLGADVTRPEHATVAGLVRSAPLELPGLTMRQIDIEPGADPLPALRQAGPESILAVRDRRVWTVDYQHTALPPGENPLRDGGVYLITGGLGGIGLTIAEDLAASVRARLVLTSRSGLPPRDQWDALIEGTGRTATAIRAIRRMESLGAQVRPVAAPADDVEGLRAVREQVLAEFGRIDGIIHAAGIPGAGILARRDLGDMRAVLAPKLAGTLALHQIFGNDQLDFVLLFSSITGTVGGFGESDYCAANAFLDAYAAGARGWARVCSVGWAGWTGVGMLADALAGGSAPEPLDHPLVGEVRRAGRVEAGGTAGNGSVTGHVLLSVRRHWVIDEHRIDGVAVLPGTAQLEMIRATVAAAGPAPSPAHAIELSEVLFIAPLRIAEDEPAEVEIVARSTGPARYEISLSHAGIRYARATAEWVLPPAGAPIDVAAIRSRCTPRPDLAERAQRSFGLVRFGPHWTNVREVWRSDTEQLTLLEVPEEHRGDLAGWVLQPALLDQATFVVGSGGTGSGGSSLPMGYGRVLIREALPARLWVHRNLSAEAGAGAEGGSLRGGDIRTDSFTVTDDSGRPVLEVADFMMRRLDSVPPSTASTTMSAESTAAQDIPASEQGWIRPAEGVEVFRRLLASDLDGHVVVSPRRLDRVADRVRAGLRPDDSAPGPAAAASPAHNGATSTEAVVAEIFSAVLGVPEVGPDDDFFDLGGTSLVAVQLIEQIRTATGLKLPMRTLFDTSTVSGMAAHVDELRGTEPTTSATQATASTATPPPEAAIPRLPRN